jgi:quinol monooxygenase YgiN
MASEDVTSINDWFNTVPIFHQSHPPVLRNLSPLPGAELTRAEIAHHSDPFVVYTEVSKPENASRSPADIGARCAKSVTHAVRESESGTLMYVLLRDHEEEGWCGALEAYESETYLMDVHDKGEAVAKMRADMAAVAGTASRHTLKLVGGYLGK